MRKQSGDFAFADLSGQTSRGAVPGNLVMLHFLGGSDEAEVSRDFLFVFTVVNGLLSLFDQPDHGFARLGLRLFSEKLEGGFQAVYMPFGLLKVFKEGFLELRMMGSV